MTTPHGDYRLKDVISELVQHNQGLEELAVKIAGIVAEIETLKAIVHQLEQDRQDRLLWDTSPEHSVYFQRRDEIPPQSYRLK